MHSLVLDSSIAVVASIHYSTMALAGQSRKDYVIQKNTWSSSSNTSQRMNEVTCKVFCLYTSKSIYIVTNFYASGELH